MPELAFELGDLGAMTRSGRPAEIAYDAMAFLLAGRFLRITARERARQVHLGPMCSPPCGLCVDITLRHTAWATDKLHKHLGAGPPHTGGVPVRDWVTILERVTSREHRRVELAAVRAVLGTRLATDHHLLPLVLAVSTQLLPSPGDARGPRRIRDFVGDPRRGVLAQRHGWAVKPERDLREQKMFAALRRAHPDGVQLLGQVLKKLDYGDPEPYQSVVRNQDDVAALKALIIAMLDDTPTHDWFMTNVDARQTYNQDLVARRFRYEIPLEPRDGDDDRR